MPVRDKISGAWRDTANMWDKVSGVWRPVVAAWKKDNGVWKMTFDGLKEIYFERSYDRLENLLSGSADYTESPGSMRARVTGYTGGYNQGCTVGWIVKGFPAGANVEIEWHYNKSSGAMNDIHIWSETHQLEIHSEQGAVTYRKLTTTQHTGWLRFFIDFFPTNQSTTWLTITKISVNGRQVWPAA